MAALSTRHAAFGDSLRQLRTERGLTQEELARQTGLHRNYIGGVERGELNPTLANVWRLADGLGLPGSELLALAE